MSSERETIKVKSSWDSDKPKTNEPEQVDAAQEEILTRAARKAKLVRILDRGIVADRLHVDLPTNLYGEWVADDPVEISRMEALGFHKDTEYAPSRSLHSSGIKEGKIGDVIHMICEKETKDIIDEIRREQFDRRHGKGKTKEEAEAAGRINKEGLATFTESKEHTARKADIERALATNS